ncbi:flagellar hook assembly protein FlgD [Nitratireductor mangrovi]|uniref:Basal-body rod modification protein FlgD n=1 Tax=Nitratireductor mangrovi TaxID=2599600 RepID=A0A5B8L4K9_9HYPH|nr:flagellar hook assembly protein FlgD [Nitratireductor mangrovi]QDZ02722.1 flagellar hook assembly protein FlgD [Nitratireductor mangrovi]
MNVVPVAAGANTAAQESSTGQSNLVDYNSFLKLLVTQMKNQDPTKPMESTDYIAQLATFSQVEQTLQTNTKLEQLMQLSLLGQADAIIGRTVSSADGTVSGKVDEVRIGSNGMVAILENGTEFPVGPGIVIS